MHAMTWRGGGYADEAPKAYPRIKPRQMVCRLVTDYAATEGMASAARETKRRKIMLISNFVYVGETEQR